MSLPVTLAAGPYAGCTTLYSPTRGLGAGGGDTRAQGLLFSPPQLTPAAQSPGHPELRIPLPVVRLQPVEASELCNCFQFSEHGIRRLTLCVYPMKTKQMLTRLPARPLGFYLERSGCTDIQTLNSLGSGTVLAEGILGDKQAWQAGPHSPLMCQQVISDELEIPRRQGHSAWPHCGSYLCTL